MRKLQTGKFGKSLLGNVRDILKGTGFNVEVMILHYCLTFQSKDSPKVTFINRVNFGKDIKRGLLEAKTKEDIFKVFEFTNEKAYCL